MANPNKFTAKEVLNKVLLDSSGNAVTANSVTSQEALNSVLDTTNNRLNMSLAGGTISGDVTISGDLTVNGSATNSYDEIVNGDLHVKSDSGNSTSAFLVEKNDGTDVMVVDTTNEQVKVGDNFIVNASGTTPVLTITGTRNDILFTESDTTNLNTLVRQQTGLFRIDTINDALDTSQIRFTIDHSTGNISIGSSEDSSKFLQFKRGGSGSGVVRGSIGTNNSKLSFIGGSGSSSHMTLDSSGNFGINKTSPEEKLHVAGNVKLFESGNTADKTYSSTGAGLFLTSYQSDSGSPYTKTTDIVAGSDGTVPSEIRFFTRASGSSSLTNAVVIDSNQQVGIGAVPTNNLHIEADSGDEGITIHSAGDTGNAITIDANRSSADAGIGTMLGKWNGTLIGYMGFFSGADTSNKDDGVLKFATTPSGGSATVALTLGSDQSATFAGDIFISNSTPLLRLDDSDVSTNVSLDGSGGIVKLASHTGQTIRFLIGSTEVSRFSSSGNLGIGSDNPVAKLVVSDGGNAGIELQPEIATDTNRITNYDRTASAYMNFRLDALTQQFLISGTERMRIDSNSRISLSNSDSGTSNTLFGYQAGNAIADSGSTGNVLIGHRAGRIANNSAFDNNVAVGFEAMQGVGARNLQGAVAVGSGALRQCDSGAPDGTVAIGFQSLYSLTTGEKNVAIGFESMLYQTDGANNTVIGYNALKNADSGESDNVVIGKEAGININHASADANVIIGSNAGFGGAGPMSGSVAIGANAMNSTGANTITGTIAVGYNSLTALTSGAGNTAIGYQALQGHTTGARNTVVGYQAMDGTGGATVLDSNDNTFMGYHAGGGTWTTAVCQYNVGIGNYSLDGAMNGANLNTAVGYGSLGAVVSGDRNVAIGADAGSTLTTGFDNVCIGRDSNVSANDAQNRIAIGKDAVSSNDNVAVIGNSSITDVLMAQDGEATIHCAGVKFPPNNALPDANANTLDDYEEGTWTPTFVSASGHAPTISATYVNDFTKVGNVVTVSLYIAFSNDGGGTDGVQISGLPFAIPANTFHMVPAVFRRTNFTSNIMQYGLTVSSTDDIGFYYTNATGDRVGLTYDDIDVASNNLILTFTYLDA